VFGSANTLTQLPVLPASTATGHRSMLNLQSKTVLIHQYRRSNLVKRL
jgi:hypothetical protein